ncbi:MAG: hypothetical protein JJLCMIEE_03376 [Acidimicrobiales bacterium]|nr:MAG: hypothetical protein EDR02_12225 [Actinomycetota bacterium]MBV6510245.1 hypothetical protein [Acidimicrobiales bacterium]RIK04210.1 MAG: hypothetical protein DCC48_14040 [Acidobacteriota bacterium]
MSSNTDEPSDRTERPDSRISRRTMLVGLAGGAAVVTGAGAYFLIRDSGSGTDGNGTQPSLDTSTGIARVGAAYLEAHPGEADPAALAEQLGIPATDSAAMEFLATSSETIQTDFDTGEVVNLDGWRLSVSEARASALVALTQ